MTPEEYRTTIAALGLSQAGAARLMGVDERTSRRWAGGERAVPEPAARLLMVIGSAPEEVQVGLVEWLMLLSGGPPNLRRKRL